MDDILITGRSQAEHDKRLIEVLALLKRYKLSVNHDKCVYNKQSVQFLGHIISHNCVTPIKDKLESIKLMPLPQTITKIK